MDGAELPSTACAGRLQNHPVRVPGAAQNRRAQGFRLLDAGDVSDCGVTLCKPGQEEGSWTSAYRIKFLLRKGERLKVAMDMAFLYYPGDSEARALV